MTTSPFTFPQDLSPPVALALFEVLQDLTDALWQQYEIDLVELIMERVAASVGTCRGGPSGVSGHFRPLFSSGQITLCCIPIDSL